MIPLLGILYSVKVIINCTVKNLIFNEDERIIIFYATERFFYHFYNS